MVKVNTTIRLDKDVKIQSMKIASELGISLNSIISLYLKNNLMRKRGLDFSIRDDAGFTKVMGNDLKQIREDSRKGKNISKTYSNLNNLLSDLKNDEVDYN